PFYRNSTATIEELRRNARDAFTSRRKARAPRRAVGSGMPRSPEDTCAPPPICLNTLVRPKRRARLDMTTIACLIMALMTMINSPADAQITEKWVTSWAGSVQGPYPTGNPSAQPDLRFTFPAAETGARDQSFRLIVRPDLWGRQVRLRLSNALGTKPV